MEETSTMCLDTRKTEKRKEKSRNAARCRRSKESEIFSNLAQVLPFDGSVVSHLDKASIMRLVIAHLRLRNVLNKVLPEKLEAHKNDEMFLKALGGIIVVLSAEGDIIFVSNNVSYFLGVSQVDVIGQNIFDMCHPCDHKEMKDILCRKSRNVKGNFSLFLRMKCTPSSKGRNVHVKSSSYKVMHLVGSLLAPSKDESDSFLHFAAVGSPIPHPANIETPLGSFTFLSKHSPDMKYTYADERMENFFGYSPENLIGKSIFEFHHVLDNENVLSSFKCLFAKGQSETGEYRFLAKGGGYAWVLTQATVIYCEKNKPESVVCVSYIISERLNKTEIYSTNQLDKEKTQSEITSYPEKKSELTSPSKVFAKLSPENHSDERPKLATCKIFAPRTADMNKGFLTFADDDSGSTMLKDEPDDLTHLAPTAGDVCVPLDTASFNSILFNNLDLSSSGRFSPLIDSKKDATLFVSCLDDNSSLSKSPEVSLPSLTSTKDEDNTFDGDTSQQGYVSFEFDSGSDDYSIRSSCIPGNGGEDLSLIFNTDLPWCSTYSNCSSSTSTSPIPSNNEIMDNSLSGLTIVLDSGGSIFTTDSPSFSPFLQEIIHAENEKRKNNNSDIVFTSKKRKKDKQTKVSMDYVNRCLSKDNLNMFGDGYNKCADLQVHQCQ